MKKFASILLALVMLISLATTAFAATVENETDHEYEAYQIFTATSQKSDGGALGNIAWGAGINSAAFLSALQGDDRFVVNNANVFAACVTAQDVAEVLAANSGLAAAFADVAVEHLTDVMTTVPANGETVDLALGYWLLVDVTTPGTGDAKNAALLQVIEDGNLTIDVKYDAPEVDKTVDDPDANIGDTVTFTLTATMPSRLDGYETYKVVFHDTLSAGLEYTNNVKVTIDGVDKTSAFTVDHNNGTLTVSCSDVLAQGAKESSKIVVTYTAVLDTDAVIGTDGNPNKVYLEYSNDPNWDGTGEEPTGNTPEDTVYVYTWEIPVAKVDESGNALTGAEFELYKADQTTLINLVKISDSVYQVCTLSGCTEHTHVTKITSSVEGKFEVEGLEQGTYYLKETKAPDGYNLLSASVKVVVGENGAITVDGSTETKTEVTVENKAGTVLPETGGMGTTLFYVFGGIMVLAAVVLLVTKKRMANA